MPEHASVLVTPERERAVTGPPHTGVRAVARVITRDDDGAEGCRDRQE